MTSPTWHKLTFHHTTGCLSSFPRVSPKSFLKCYWLLWKNPIKIKRSLYAIYCTRNVPYFKTLTSEKWLVEERSHSNIQLIKMHGNGNAKICENTAWTLKKRISSQQFKMPVRACQWTQIEMYSIGHDCTLCSLDGKHTQRPKHSTSTYRLAPFCEFASFVSCSSETVHPPSFCL